MLLPFPNKVGVEWRSSTGCRVRSSRKPTRANERREVVAGPNRRSRPKGKKGCRKLWANYASKRDSPEGSGPPLGDSHRPSFVLIPLRPPPAATLLEQRRHRFARRGSAPTEVPERDWGCPQLRVSRQSSASGNPLHTRLTLVASARDSLQSRLVGSTDPEC